MAQVEKPSDIEMSERGGIKEMIIHAIQLKDDLRARVNADRIEEAKRRRVNLSMSVKLNAPGEIAETWQFFPFQFAFEQSADPRSAYVHRDIRDILIGHL
jgi:hypothetical protein